MRAPYDFGPLDPKERILPHSEEEGADRRPLLASALVILVMALFAGGLWLAYHAAHGQSEGKVPLIRAERTPIKVRPSSPGGLRIPDRNMLIYGEKEPKIERLLPGPEEPLPRPVAKPSPTPVRAAPVTPAEQKKLVPSSAAPRPRPDEAEARIQLGALRSEVAARAEWQRLRRAEPEILGHLSVETVRSDLGEKGVFYRIEAGPFASSAEASKICRELKRHKIACLLVR